MTIHTPDIAPAGRYWVLGGRWVDNARHLSWPRVYGPFADYAAARDNAASLNASPDAAVRYIVVADLPETAANI